MNDEKGKVAPSTMTAPTSQSESSRSISLSDNRVDSRALFRGVREITIAHGEETYRLRLTAQNKLILTK